MGWLAAPLSFKPHPLLLNNTRFNFQVCHLASLSNPTTTIVELISGAPQLPVLRVMISLQHGMFQCTYRTRPTPMKGMGSQWLWSVFQ